MKITVLILTGFLSAGLAPAQIADLILDQAQQPLTPTGAINPGLGTAFGEAVAIDGDLMIVGAPHESHDDDREGAAYLFQRVGSTWMQTQRIAAPDFDVRDQFGSAVDVTFGTGSLSYAVVGAPFADGGKVYLFKRDGGGLFEYEDTLLVADPNTTGPDFFGTAVAIDFFVPPTSQTGDPVFIVAAGAPSNIDTVVGGNHHGSLSIFQSIGSPAIWINTDKFFGANGARLGTSVAVTGPSILAGAIGAHDAGFGGGAAYLYTQGNQLPSGAFTYNVASRLEIDVPHAGEGLGSALAADWEGGSAAVAAETNNALGYGTGAVYIFEITTFGLVRTEYQMLQPVEVEGGDLFGASVSMSEHLLAVGAPGVGPNGSVYLYDSSGFAASWIEAGRIIPQSVAPTDQCLGGTGAAVFGRSAAAGCPATQGGSLVFVHDATGIFADGFESGNLAAWP